MSTTKCPYCFFTLQPSEAAFACSTCPPSDDDLATRARGVPVAGPAIIVESAAPGSRSRPVSAECPTCRTTATLQACPDCHAVLPPRWLDTNTTCIALAGTVYSGKSVYIGVAVQQLEILATMLGGILTPFTPETQTEYEERYRSTLYKERGLIQATNVNLDRHNIPMMFQYASNNGQPQVLVLRDIAGEHLKKSDLSASMFRFFTRADGIIYLIDPLQIDLVRNQLRGFVPVGRKEFDEPVPVLANLSRLLLTAEPGHTKSGVRLALTLSKFDALQSLSEVEQSMVRRAMSVQGAAMLRDPSLLSPSFDKADSDLLNLEVESLLQELGAVQLLNLARQDFDQRRWFAVSALGHQPGRTVGDAGITPFRCLDPIKWILNQNGALPGS